MMRLPAVLRALARHLGIYAQLGAAAAVEYRSAWLRRIWLAVAAIIAFVAGSCALWLAGLMAVWDTGWRMAYVVGSAVLLLLFAVVAWLIAMTRPAAGPVASVLKSELHKDAELFQQWQSSIQS
jgi:uncharacterized membrane protein YqjE